MGWSRSHLKLVTKCTEMGPHAHPGPSAKGAISRSYSMAPRRLRFMDSNSYCRALRDIMSNFGEVHLHRNGQFEAINISSVTSHWHHSFSTQSGFTGNFASFTSSQLREGDEDAGRPGAFNEPSYPPLRAHTANKDPKLVFVGSSRI